MAERTLKLSHINLLLKLPELLYRKTLDVKEQETMPS